MVHSEEYTSICSEVHKAEGFTVNEWKTKRTQMKWRHEESGGDMELWREGGIFFIVSLIWLLPELTVNYIEFGGSSYAVD